MTDKEFVRANWELWHRCDGSYRDYPKDTILLQRTNGRWNDFPTWAAAAEFTRERLEHIRQLEAEIKEVSNRVIGEDEIKEWVDSPWGGCAPNCGVKEAIRRHVRASRTLARLEAALADLKRGMKTTP